MQNDIDKFVNYMLTKLITLDKLLFKRNFDIIQNPKQLELEIAFGRSPNELNLNNIKKFLKKSSIDNVNKFRESHALDITYNQHQRNPTDYHDFQTLRFTINNIDDIKAFCDYQSTQLTHDILLQLNYEIMVKSRFVKPSKTDLYEPDLDTQLSDELYDKFYGRQYDCRFNISDEKPIKPDINILNTITQHQINKTYRYKKRYSNEINNVCQVDITLTKTGKGKDFITSNCLRQKELVELEFEFIGDRNFNRDENNQLIINSDFKDFINTVVVYYIYFKNTLQLITLTESLNVEQSIQNMKLTTVKNTFVGYNIVPLNNTVNIFKTLIYKKNDYIVTYKADGERRLLYIYKIYSDTQTTLSFYLINTKQTNNVEKLTSVTINNTILDMFYQNQYMKRENSHYIFDCEMFDDVSGKIVYIFDVIVYDDSLPDTTYTFDKRYLDMLRFKYIIDTVIVKSGDEQTNGLKNLLIKEYYYPNHIYPYSSVYELIKTTNPNILKYQTIKTDFNQLNDYFPIGLIDTEQTDIEKVVQLYEGIVNGMKQMYYPYLTQVYYTNEVLNDVYLTFTTHIQHISGLHSKNNLKLQKKDVEIKLDHNTIKLTELQNILSHEEVSDIHIEKGNESIPKITKFVISYKKMINLLNELIEMVDVFEVVIQTNVFELYSGLYNLLYVSNTIEVLNVLKYNQMKELKKHVINDGIIIMPTDVPYPKKEFAEKKIVEGKLSDTDEQKNKIQVNTFDHQRKIWLNQFKWKPIEKLTIDFRLELTQTDDEEYTYNLMMTDKRVRGKVYSLFSPTELYEQTSDVSTLRISRSDINKTREDNVQIISGSVYECLFENGRWIAYRSRFDKDFPNQVRVAYEVWSLINNDVKPDFMLNIKNAITHTKNLSVLEDEKGSYFTTDEIQKSQRTIMNKVHLTMKRILYTLTVRELPVTSHKKVFLYETACGQFGDLHNWSNIGITDLFVTDIDYTAVLEGKKRLETSSYRINLNGYAIVDLTKSITDLNAVLSKNIPINEHKKMQETLKTYFIDETPQFDISSCQFALHYFCKNKESFATYIYNATLKLKSGGFFIATVMDGKSVFDMLHGKKSINGYMKSSSGENVEVWNIEKIIEHGEEKWIRLQEFGQGINVKINTIGKTHTEYLVNVDVITKFLATKQIDLVRTVNFSSYTSKLYMKSDEYKGLKTFSDLHVLLMFRKK